MVEKANIIDAWIDPTFDTKINFKDIFPNLAQTRIY